MRKLDRKRPFGKISPPYQQENFDRAAFYEQDGRFFDQHDREIVPGIPLAEQLAKVDAAAGTESRHPLDHDGDGRPGGSLPAGPVDSAMTPAELLRQADEMPWAQFRKQAKLIFGPTCPASKEDIKRALQEAIAGMQTREKVRMERALDAPAAKKAEPPQAKPAAQAAPQDKAATGVDLAAWGRGKQEYLFGDIRKAIRAQYNRVVTERRDALDLLIEQGVITAESARRDIV